jgi:peptidoglycan/xylan/chitin deacetylase (PgdA/CDA1 family)
MAQVERGLGVRSTYFILVSSKHYNPLEGENAGMIKQIFDLGHEIGLHYDVKQYECYSPDATLALEMEAHVLENITGEKVRSISCHAPTGPSSFMKVNGYLDADDPRLRDIYVHDSGRLWTVKSLSVLLNDHPKRVQLLIHPCHWEGKVARRTKLDDFLLDVLLFLHRIRTVAIRIIHSQESCEN